MMRHLKEFQKVSGARYLAPRMKMDSTSASFLAFVSAVEELLRD